MKTNIFLLFILFILFGCQHTRTNHVSYAVKSCECTLKKEYSSEKPWNLPWDDNAAIKERIEKCRCNIDLEKIDNLKSLLKTEGFILK